MAEMGPSLENTVDPKNGFCSKPSTFHSILPPVPLPPATEPLSISHYVLSLLRSHSDIPPESFTAAAFIDAVSGHRVTYAEFIAGSRNLAATLRRSIPELSTGAVAFVLCPSSVHLPVLYFALLSLGVVVSPANPTSSDSEIARLIGLSKPRIGFATRENASKLPSFPLGTVVTDSPDFHSMMAKPALDSHVVVRQSDPAAILYSSGTTGLVKGVWLTHRNFVAVIAGSFHNRAEAPEGAPAQPASLVTLPLFHIYGISMMMRAVSLGHTSVIMERFDFEGMLRAVEKYRVSFMPASPPLVVALTKLGIVKKYDLSSLLVVGSGGAPLREETAKRFIARFPGVALSQGYGLTETGGGVTRMIGPDECKHYGSVGRLAENAEAKIVDPVSGKALPPGQQGELWLRGPMTMKALGIRKLQAASCLPVYSHFSRVFEELIKASLVHGYVGDDKATAAIIDPEGWLKTGDICYFDSDGFLFVVDRLKELIKYKAYQVAPAELEHLLQSNPGIADAAVIPYPDEDAGQIPMAFVVRKPGSSINEAEVMNFIAKQVAPYKKIRRVAFINAIPKSPTGKILRKELVKHASPTASARL